jgi:hypothetical protein
VNVRATPDGGNWAGACRAGVEEAVAVERVVVVGDVVAAAT